MDALGVLEIARLGLSGLVVAAGLVLIAVGALGGHFFCCGSRGRIDFSERNSGVGFVASKHSARRSRHHCTHIIGC